ncbi:monovalent cation/H+ antiporter complex subunit F [Georgenia sp. Z1344]|uniref:monovalent cation/H+ antiporter complex subunit F n=1 Tax=Georgenia sp. Z1344 TaxID=3416706 RepID=UPI003CEB6744
MMEAVVYGCLGIVVLAVFVALVRMERGPSTLDRAVSTDVVTASVVALVGLLIAWTGDAAYLPMLVVLTLVGFLTTVTVARFTAVEKSDEARILTKEELAQVIARERELEDDDAPVHGPDSPRVTGEDVDDEDADVDAPTGTGSPREGAGSDPAGSAADGRADGAPHGAATGTEQGEARS